jgi:DNA polymerase-3 subunit beta
MQFSVSKSALVQALALASRAIEKRTTIPILTNVKLEAKEDFLTITGTDLEAAISVRVAAEVKEPGATTIPGAKLYSYVRLLPEGAVKFKLDAANQWTTITSGKSRTKMAGVPVDSFPEAPAEPESLLTVPVGAFAALVNRTKLAISAEASRFTLNGALLECRDGRLHMVATDGHRLAFASQPSEGEKLSTIIPLNALKHIASLTEGVESLSIGQDDNHLFFRAGQALLISRKMSGNFPDYKRVLPGKLPRIVTLKRAELAGAVSRVMQFADERSHAIRLALKDGTLEVFSSSVETGESTETVECDYAGGGEVEVGFNATYLLEFLSVLDCESVTFHLNDGKAAGELRPAGGGDEYRYVVMPMRI